MTDEQIKQNAEAYYAKNFTIWQTDAKKDNISAYIAGAHSRDAEIKAKPNIYDLFDALDPNQKAAFVYSNMAWARNIDLVNELKERILWKDKA